MPRWTTSPPLLYCVGLWENMSILAKMMDPHKGLHSMQTSVAGVDSQAICSSARNEMKRILGLTAPMLGGWKSSSAGIVRYTSNLVFAADVEMTYKGKADETDRTDQDDEAWTGMVDTGDSDDNADGDEELLVKTQMVAFAVQPCQGKFQGRISAGAVGQC